MGSVEQWRLSASQTVGWRSLLQPRANHSLVIPCSICKWMIFKFMRGYDDNSHKEQVSMHCYFNQLGCVGIMSFSPGESEFISAPLCQCSCLFPLPPSVVTSVYAEDAS